MTRGFEAADAVFIVALTFIVIGFVIFETTKVLARLDEPVTCVIQEP